MCLANNFEGSRVWPGVREMAEWVKRLPHNLKTRVQITRTHVTVDTIGHASAIQCAPTRRREVEMGESAEVKGSKPGIGSSEEETPCRKHGRRQEPTSKVVF